MSHGIQHYHFPVLKGKFSFTNRLVLRTNVLDKVATDPLKRWIHRVGKYRVISSLFPFFHSLLVKLMVFSCLVHVHSCLLLCA